MIKKCNLLVVGNTSGAELKEMSWSKEQQPKHQHPIFFVLNKLNSKY